MVNIIKVLTNIIDSSGVQSGELIDVFHALQIIKDKINYLPTKTRYDRLKREALLQTVNDVINSLKTTRQQLDKANSSAREMKKKLDHLNILIEELHLHQRIGFI